MFREKESLVLQALFSTKFNSTQVRISLELAGRVLHDLGTKFSLLICIQYFLLSSF